MRLRLCILLLIVLRGILCAQEPVSIKVRKEQRLVKVYFDNTDLRLNAVDRFGNPCQNRVMSYKLWIKGRKEPLPGFNNSLTPDMVRELRQLRSATKIFFTEILVEDDEGHPLKLPDVIEVWFPDCRNCDVGKKKRR